MTQNKKPYEWDFSGACAPSSGWPYPHQETFSLGIFQWIPRKDGKGVKKGKVVKRIKGVTSKPQEAFDKATQEVARRNEELFGQGGAA
ncbi:hypothetical protein F9K50_07390 [bacterium]|nr:MAG: hypothetical protein F9K50_07390 [bacterium]